MGRIQRTSMQVALIPIVSCLLPVLKCSASPKYFLVETKGKVGNIIEENTFRDHGSSDISTDRFTNWANKVIWNGTKKEKGVELECRTRGRKACVFPFTYKGVEYNRCIWTYSNSIVQGKPFMISGSYGQFWCATTEGYNENSKISQKTGSCDICR